MPGAVIVINQPTGAGAGVADVARRDVWNGQQIELVVGTGGNSSQNWSFLDKPAGSAATITNADQITATFTPDVLGTYRVQLVTNGGGPSNVKVKVIRVRKDSTGVLVNRGWALPGLGEGDGESNYDSNLRAWAEVFEYIAADLMIVANRHLSPIRIVYPGFMGVKGTQVTAAGGEVIGALVFDPSALTPANTGLTRTIKLSVLLQATAGMTAEISLFNLDTAQAVTGSTMTSTSATPERKLSAAFTIGASPNMPSSLQTYQIRLRISAGAPGVSDFATCSLAQLEVSYT